MKYMLKAPGDDRLKLKYDQLLSSFAFNLNLRRYNSDSESDSGSDDDEDPNAADLDPDVEPTLARSGSRRQGLTLVHFSAQRKRCVWDRGCK